MCTTVLNTLKYHRNVVRAISKTFNRLLDKIISILTSTNNAMVSEHLQNTAVAVCMMCFVMSAVAVWLLSMMSTSVAANMLMVLTVVKAMTVR